MLTENIKILKPGHNGYGILIEQDAGYIDPNFEKNKTFINEMNNLHRENSMEIAEPLVLYVVLQKYGVRNNNGRIYLEKVLKRENDKYQTLIKEKRAFGECVLPGTEIFTVDGWKKIETISEDEIIATLNLENNNIEYQKIDKKVILDYDDDLIEIKNNSSIDMVLTKNHKMVIFSDDSYSTPTAEHFYDNYEKYITHKIATSEDSLNKIELSDLELNKLNYKGKVYCVTVPNKTWLMRYNNKVAWTHNCEHPDSFIINSSRVSHNILETWWEGKTLMGKIEIIMSPGFIKSGIISCEGDRVANLLRKGLKVGVSSRGVGSVKDVNGIHIVQDDFELICWDVVITPSTPGSWILQGKEESKLYVENSNIKNKELLNKFNNFLKN